MGRAARNVNGTVILYADHITDSMKAAIKETDRRRQIQLDHNRRHNITPQSIVKEITDIRNEDRQTDRNQLKKMLDIQPHTVSPSELPKLLSKLESDMKTAAKNLEFELAAVLRDQIEDLKNSPINISTENHLT